jgi:transposase
VTPDSKKSDSKKIEAKKSIAKKPVARKAAPAGQAKGEVNKSAEIRKVASEMKARGDKPRPVVIIGLLKKQGVEVSSPQVSMVLKKMGFRPRKRRKSTEVAVAATGSARAKAASGASKKVRIEDLLKAQKVAAQMGGIDRALAALQALRGFE